MADDNPTTDLMTSPYEVTANLPSGFAFLSFGPGRFVLVNENSGGHRSSWPSVEAMTSAAWDWWHDVRSERS